MKLRKTKTGFNVETLEYQLSYSSNNPYYVNMFFPEEEIKLSVYVASSFSSLDLKDITHRISIPEVKKVNKDVMITFETKSSLWKNKKHVFICREENFEYFVTLCGKGNLDSCRYFEGFRKGGNMDRFDTPYFIHNFSRPPADFLDRSVPGFTKFFNPQPNMGEHQYCRYYEPAVICVGYSEFRDAFRYGPQNYFTPAPFCYCFTGEREKKWVGVGVAAKAGEWNFVDYRYTGGEGFGFEIIYDGNTEVAGSWESPHLVFVSGKDEYRALGTYVGFLRENGYIESQDKHIPAWWHRPMFCGWGEQMYLGNFWPFTSFEDKSKTDPGTFCKERYYRRFLNTLWQNGIDPGTLTIDDRWQVRHGSPEPDRTKWPDLRGFIDSLHKRGMKVLLWFFPWATDGIPPSECILKDGVPLTTDPTNPAFEKRLRNSIRIMLGETGGHFNADGFKIDFTNRVPAGRGISYSGKLWGVELLKKLMWIIYDEAKKVKSDSLIVAHTANPYFADTVDMLRLNDMFSDKASQVEMMRHRARVAKIACPNALIDTDNNPLVSKKAWLEYMKFQPEIGVPSLYYASHIDTTGEKITRTDFAALRRVWQKYEGKVQSGGSPLQE